MGFDSHQIQNEMTVFISDDIENRIDNNLIEISNNSSQASTLIINSPRDFGYLIESKKILYYHISYVQRSMSLNYNRLIIVPHYGKESYSFLNVLKNRKMIDNTKLGILEADLYFGGFSNEIKQKYKDKIILEIIGNNTWTLSQII